MSFERDWLKQWNHFSPDSIAIQEGESGAHYTYSAFYKAACQGAALLRQLGVKKGDRIATLAMNELDYVVLFFAAQRVGAILVPINFRLTQREVDHIISDCDPTLIVHQEAYSPLVEKTPNFNRRKTLLLSEFSRKIQEHPADIHANFANFDFNEECMIIYTSGTTGSPKGAVMTHSMLFWNSINTGMRLNLTQDDCTVIFLPFFHTGGWNVLTTPLLHRGGKVIFLKKFDPEVTLDLCEKEKVSILFGVPTTMDMLSRAKRFESSQLKSIRYAIVGGEPMPIELIHTWHKKGIPIRQGYGLTEFGPNVFSLNETDAIRKIGSIGFPNFYTEVKVMASETQEARANEIGELWLKGPMCMHGYWKNPQATAETIENNWLKTGDLVKRDTEGYFYVMGRKKDMFKSGGENVYPSELEKVLRSLPGVREVAVIGVPDQKWGEVGKAFLVPETGIKLEEAEVLGYCQKNLAKFKIPKYFRFVSDLPKGDSGKILKRKLQEVYPD